MELNFKKEKLLAFYLGGKIDGCNIEMHDVIFVVGKTNEEFFSKIKEKWIGNQKSLHIDSYVILELIDGFEINITNKKQEKSKNNLYFVNIGSYKNNKFGENHFMNFCIATSKEEAIEVSKKLIPKSETMIHCDNIYEINDCIKINEIDNYHINIKYSGKMRKIKSTNGYFKV